MSDLPEATNGRHFFLLHYSLPTPPLISSFLYSTSFSHICRTLHSSLTLPSVYPVLIPSTPPSFLPSYPFLAPSGPRRIPLNCCCGISVLPLLLPQPHCYPWDEACPCIPRFPTCQSNLHALSSSSRPTPTLRLPHSCFCPSTGPPETAPQPQSASPWPLPFTLHFRCSGVQSYHTASPAQHTSRERQHGVRE